MTSYSSPWQSTNHGSMGYGRPLNWPYDIYPRRLFLKVQGGLKSFSALRAFADPRVNVFVPGKGELAVVTSALFHPSYLLFPVHKTSDLQTPAFRNSGLENIDDFHPKFGGFYKQAPVNSLSSAQWPSSSAPYLSSQTACLDPTLSRVFPNVCPWTWHSGCPP